MTAALRPLPPGLPPDEVEKLRWEAFGHRQKSSILSPDDLVRFTAARGFVLRLPEAGLHYPSILEAAVGRPLLEHGFDERGRKADGWVRESVTSGRLLHAAVLAQRATLVERGFVADFFALSGHQGDLEDHVRAQRAGQLSAEAAALCAWLVREGRPLSQSELASLLQMRGPLGARRLRQRLDEAVQRLLVVPVGWRATDESGKAMEPICDLLPRDFADCVEKGRTTSPEAARQRLACRYLRNVLVEASHEMARVLGWTDVDTLEALRALEAEGEVAAHPSSRRQRWIFQATATDLLAGS